MSRTKASSRGIERSASDFARPVVEMDPVQRLEVDYSGLDVATYLSCRRVGLMHDEIMEAHALGADLPAYCFLRSVYDHATAVIEAGATGTHTHQQAVYLGVTTEELNELRRSYESHVEQFWADLDHHLGADRPLTPPSTVDYLIGRRIGLAHSAALDLACRVSIFRERQHRRAVDEREIELWARCRLAGLHAAMVLPHRPRLGLDELGVLHSALFIVAAQDNLDRFDHAELLWVASRARHRTIDIERYLSLRVRRVPRVIARRRSITSRRATPAGPSGSL